jgi:hypothetical protein
MKTHIPNSECKIFLELFNNIINIINANKNESKESIIEIIDSLLSIDNKEVRYLFDQIYGKYTEILTCENNGGIIQGLLEGMFNIENTMFSQIKISYIKKLFEKIYSTDHKKLVILLGRVKKIENYRWLENIENETDPDNSNFLKKLQETNYPRMYNELNSDKYNIANNLLKEMNYKIKNNPDLQNTNIDNLRFVYLVTDDSHYNFLKLNGSSIFTHEDIKRFNNNNDNYKYDSKDEYSIKLSDLNFTGGNYKLKDLKIIAKEFDIKCSNKKKPELEKEIKNIDFTVLNTKQLQKYCKFFNIEKYDKCKNNKSLIKLIKKNI